MAMAAVQYPPASTLPAGQPHSPASRAYRYNPSPSSPSSLGKPSSFSTYPLPSSRGVYRERPPLRDNDTNDHNTTAGQLGVSQGAFAAAKYATDHCSAKLQKRSSVGSSKGSSSRHRSSLPPNSPHSPSAESADANFPPIPPSSAKAAAKERFKLNLRKIGQQKREEDDQPTLDLSQTAEENERRSGLGISLKDQSAQLPLSQPGSPLTGPAHSRNVSYGSQISGSSMSFKPTVPFSLPSKPSPLAYNQPPLITSFSNPVVEDDYNDRDEPTLSYITSIESPPQSPSVKALPRSDTATSISSGARFTGAEGSSRNNRSLSLQHSTGRPRGNTNQSVDSLSTPKSPGSLERAFSFMTRGASPEKGEPADPVTRQASIQAARQAFEEHETAEAAKHHRREQKAALKARRRQARLSSFQGKTRLGGLGPYRRKARPNSSSRAASEPAATTGLGNANTRGKTKKEADGVAYSSMPAGPAPSQGERAFTGRQAPPPKTRKARTSFKNKYLRFLSWLRTKVLRFGRHRRRVVA